MARTRLSALGGSKPDRRPERAGRQSWGQKLRL